MIDFSSTGTAAKRVEPCGAGERGRESEVVFAFMCVRKSAQRERERARASKSKSERESEKQIKR